MTKGFLYATASMLSLGATLTLTPASAQQLEEITVTARKQEENLMQVPLSITAVTAESLESANIKDPQDLAAFTPGLFISYGISTRAGARNLFFRGDPIDAGLTFIDGAPYGGNANPDINAMERIEVLVGPQAAYFGRSTFTGAINYVTKDPADTFKGRIDAEVASYNSNSATLVLEGPIVKDRLGIRMTASHDYRGPHWTNMDDTNDKWGWAKKDSVSAVIVANLNDNLKARAFFEYSLDKFGYTPTVALSGYGSNPAVPNEPYHQYQSRQLYCNQGGTYGSWWCGALPSAKTLPSMDAPGKNHIISADNAFTPLVQKVLFDNFYNLEPTLFDPHWLDVCCSKAQVLSEHLVVNYTSQSGWAFNSSTALHQSKSAGVARPLYRNDIGVPNPYAQSGIYHMGGVGANGQVLTAASNLPSVANPNFQGSPWFGFHLMNENEIWDASQELRVTSPQDQRLRGTAGFNFFNRISPGNDNYGIQPGVAAGMGVAGNLSRSVTSTPAIFGGLYYDLTPEFTISAEGRYQWDGISSKTNFVAGGVPQDRLHDTFKSFSPRISLDYQFTPDHMAYALWSVGYSPGGFNSSIVGQSAAISAQLASLGSQLTFQQEKLINWEAGLKSTWFDGRVRTTIDGYFDKWQNGQVANSLSVVAPNGATQMVSVTQNVGLTNLYGIEFTMAAAVTENLTITANYNLVKSEIKQYVYFPNGVRITSACAVANGSTCTTGNSFPLNPVGSTFAITPTYTAHLTGDWDWYARMDWKHRGKYYIDFTNLAWIPPTDTVDLRLGVKDATKTLEIFATNLTNQQEFQSGEVGFDAMSYNPANVLQVRVVLPQKRMFGIRANYSF